MTTLEEVAVKPRCVPLIYCFYIKFFIALPQRLQKACFYKKYLARKKINVSTSFQK